VKIEEVLERFLVQLAANGRAWNTTQQYVRHVRLLALYFREHQIEDLAHDDIARFLSSPSVTNMKDGRPKKATSMNALRSSVRNFCSYAHACGYTRGDPARLVQRARTGAPPPRAISPEEERRFFAALDGASGFEAERDRVLFGLLRRSGIRLSSVLALEVGDVDLDQGLIVLRKTKSGRVEHVWLSSAVVEELRPWIARRGAGMLFASRQGGALGARHAQRRFEGWWQLAGNTRHARPHDMRHAFALELYRRTGDVLLVKEALGHRSITSTLVYAIPGPDRLRESLRAGASAG
jgi:integrase/recombinase XerC